MVAPETSLFTVGASAVYGIILAAQVCLAHGVGMGGAGRVAGSRHSLRMRCICAQAPTHLSSVPSHRHTSRPLPHLHLLQHPQEQYTDSPFRVNEMRLYTMLKRHNSTRLAAGCTGQRWAGGRAAQQLQEPGA